MRLTPEEIENIKESVYSSDPDAKVFLFGSRTDDTLKGGDIDILIESKIIAKAEIRKIRWSFFKKFGEQKMDIVVDNGQKQDPFIHIAHSKSILL